jgi:hypothetical protein
MLTIDKETYNIADNASNTLQYKGLLQVSTIQGNLDKDSFRPRALKANVVESTVCWYWV